jgi:ABC-2 type transport system permease protein
VTAAAPAGLGRIVSALTVHELRLALRRGESLLATFVIPVVVLWLFASVPILPTDGRPAVDTLLPGTIALSIIASSLVALGIATGYDRAYGVLKRLGGSPASRGSVVLAKLLATLVLEAVQVGLLVAIAVFALRWSASGPVDLPLLALAVALGTAAFAGLGLLVAGTLRAEATLALTNGLFLGALALGGIIVPLDRLPPPLATVAEILPAAALTDALRIALGTDLADPAGPLLLLAAWAAAFTALAAWRFRWD